MFILGNSSNVAVSGNSWGGVVNADIPGGYTYSGCVFGGGAAANSVQSGNFANGIGLSVNQVGLVPTTPTILGTVGNYQAAVNDSIIIGTAANTTAWAVLTPLTPPIGRTLTVKDGIGAAATHNITVGGGGGPNIDGSSAYTLTNNYGWVTIVWNGTVWNKVATG